MLPPHIACVTRLRGYAREDHLDPRPPRGVYQSQLRRKGALDSRPVLGKRLGVASLARRPADAPIRMGIDILHINHDQRRFCG